MVDVQEGRCCSKKEKTLKEEECQHAESEKCMIVSSVQTFSSARLLQSSLESSELSMSTSSQEALVRCSQLRA